MIYRTAHRATYRNINQNLGSLSYRIAQLQNQLATERRINTPSDDPTGAARVLGIRSTLANIKQYQTNIAVSDLWLNDSGAAVQSIKETLDEIFTKTEQGATDTYSAEQRKIIATEVNELFESLIQYGDTKIGDTYIFGGQRVSTQPFGLKVEAQKVIAGCQNSDKWTGKVINYGDARFNNRPDLPIHSQDFLIEVVQAGGVDSRYYTRTSGFNTARLGGAGYDFKFTANGKQYNDTEVRFVSGPQNSRTIGEGINGILFSGGGNLDLNHDGERDAINVQYVYGDSTGTTAAWSASTNTLVVSLQTEARQGASIGVGSSGLSFAGTMKPIQVNYEYASSPASGTTASWNNGTLTVRLQNDGGTPPSSLASAGAVMSALNNLQTTDPLFSAAVADGDFTYAQMSASNASGIVQPDHITYNNTQSGGRPISVASAGAVMEAIDNLYATSASFSNAVADYGLDWTAMSASNRSGIVQPDNITYNNGTTVQVDGDQITVYLERADEPPEGTGEIIATAEDIYDAIRANSAASAMITVTLSSGSSAAVVTPTPVYTQLKAGEPYTLAWAEANPKGTQNGLIFSAKNNPNGVPSYVGSAGNNFSIEYAIDSSPFISSAYLEYNSATGEFKVHAAVDEAIYNKIFIQVYNDPASACYKDPVKAHERALEDSITTTASDVMALFAASAAASGMVDIKLADGNSGEGNINLLKKTQFTEGYDQPAMFRVSQDGGKTWGPPMSFGASEYKSGDMFYNSTLGHASTTTGLRGTANDLVFTAKQMGTWGNDLTVQYDVPRNKPAALEVVADPDRPWEICVNLAVDADGNIVSTANDVMSAINNHPIASQLMTADLANYHEGGYGIVTGMECQKLSVAPPYEVDGKTVITPLGYATKNVSFNYSAPSQKDPNIIFQALEQGPDGNDIGIRYTTSADPTFYASASVADGNYQDFTSVRYETVIENGVEKDVLVVHLATSAIPSCPDEKENPEASAAWKELYPVYSCTSSRAVLSTAGSVVEALIKKNLEEPENALVWASMERYPEGNNAKVGVTNGTVWLDGGNDEDDASEHGVNLQFIPDGTALQVGDVFEVPVGWYRGDSENIDINAGNGFRNTMNVTGDDIFGDNAASDNIFDTIQRLVFALNNNDTEAVGRELPAIKAAIEKVTTMETAIGTRLIRNEFISSNLETSKYNSESLLSTTEDAAFEELITDLKNSQTVLEAVMGATGLTNKLSLLNYL